MNAPVTVDDRTTIILTDADIRFASVPELRRIAKGGRPSAFVWPDEGDFQALGIWAFHGVLEGIMEPLAIDQVTAQMLMIAYNYLDEDNRDTMVENVAHSREKFRAVTTMTLELRASLLQDG